MRKAASSIARSRNLVRGATALMVGLVVAAGIAVWMLRQGAVADAVADNHRLGVVLAEQIMRTFQSVDLVLQEVSDNVARFGVDDQKSLHDMFGGLDMHEALRKRLTDLPQAEAFTLVDATGQMVNTSRQWPMPEYSLADQEYFRTLAGRSDPGPYISMPGVSHSSGAQTVFLARRLIGWDGHFLGVVVAPLLLGHFETFFARTGLSDGAGVTILRHDGLVLLHFPVAGVAPGARMPQTAKWYDMVAAGGGEYRSPGTFGTLGPVFVSVHPLTLFPIVVDVTRVEAAALARWWRQAIWIGIGTFAASVGFTLLLVALSRQITLMAASQVRISQQVATIQASEARYAAQSTLLETTLQHMNQGLMVIDPGGRIAVCNRRAMEILELPASLMAGHPRVVDVIALQTQRGELDAPGDAWLQSVLPKNALPKNARPKDPRPKDARPKDALGGDVSAEDASSELPQPDVNRLLGEHAAYERRRPNGTVVEVRTATLPDGGLVRTYTDVTARTTAAEMLGVTASHDPLTGLVNRTGFSVRLGAALAAAQQGETALAVLCLDLDRFKAVNDTLGHGAGDQLLIQVGQRMRETARASDIVARLGGDEFAIVLPGANRIGAELTCRRLVDSIQKPFLLGGQSAQIGVSIGIAFYPGDGGGADGLLRNADMALYQAKAAGRNTWRAYASEDDQRDDQRIRLEQEFRTAVELRQFTLAYQPICDATTSETEEFEALLRWDHAGRGPIPPEAFIPLAEQTGLIIPLGHWVIEAACAEAATWEMPLRVAVNLSPTQFHEHDLPRFIQEVLRRTGLPPRLLALEITEMMVQQDVESAVKTMRALRALGIRIVLDDVGTTGSNLNYLRGLPLDAVKLDRRFLRALNTDPQARALVEAILAAAHAVGLDVVGEGVETPEQLALLRHLGCRWVQGYFLGRPVSGEETRQWIRHMPARTVDAEEAVDLTVRA